MHIFYSPVAEVTPEASASPLLWGGAALASVKQLAARENSIWDDLVLWTAQGILFQLLTAILHLQNLEIIAERGQLYTMSIELS
ncbi:hypothetical protein K503DRAFT_773954 [Rhizopogon vinicolor AM-OR11-026]|uniref:Uncharacterized protein n=1 Tax=Rhizopogon vinicolor AM-OR11-026 TaxID=1314800 RepID=A0A1B7MQT5_9AGAM|nr:hypothetical protein K503DRAFT_773954 [Rhizopogon vinicolor AM-OR11-026]